MTAAFVLFPFVGSSKLKLTPRNHTPDMPRIHRPTRPKENCLASLRQMTGYLFCAHPVWQPQQAKAVTPQSHVGEKCSWARFLMEFVHDQAEPPSPELIHSLTTSASQDHRPRNHTAEFGATNRPHGSSEEELLGFTATTAALVCD
jgi:hypothetical protein